MTKNNRFSPEVRQRELRDDLLKVEIQRVYDENHSVYGVRKLWRQLLRENINVARCTVARLIKAAGLTGVRRGCSADIRDAGPDLTPLTCCSNKRRELSTEIETKDRDYQ